MKTETLNEFLELTKYAAVELNTIYNDADDVLRSAKVGLTTDDNPLLTISAFWNESLRNRHRKQCECCGQRNTEREPKLLQFMPALEHCHNETEVDNALEMLTQKIQAAREELDIEGNNAE